jgi:T5SS/PEP-CTERM-associated repeat protein
MSMSWGENSSRVVCAIILSTLWALACAYPAAAVITAVGDIDPPYDATDPWVLSTDVIVGHTADADLLVSGGSQVQDNGAAGEHKTVISSAVGVAAAVTVTGSGSVWESPHTICIGEYGNGAMTIESGGSLVARDVLVASERFSTGRLVVTGSGTAWQGDEALVFGSAPQTEIIAIIAYNGDGEVVVSDGAKVTADAGTVYVGYQVYGTGSLIVTGPGSVWEGAGYMTIGYSGTGSLVVSDGGTVTNTRDAGIAGHSSSGYGSATVTDPGSTWQVGGTLYVGQSRRGDLLISAGGRVESEGGFVSSIYWGGSVATVTGPGSVWNDNAVLEIGYGGRGSMRVEDGGHVTSERSDVGWEQSDTGMVEVRGTGSAWDTHWQLWLGVDGAGTMYIEDGGHVTSATAALGVGASGKGTGLAVVDGAGSVWSNAGVMSLGGQAVGPGYGAGTLRILNGGLVESDVVVAWGRTAVEGNGTLRTRMLTTEGTIRPGASIGTLTLDGDLTMNSGSVLETEIDNSGHGDKLLVTGDVNIVGGTVKALSTETMTHSQQYVIVEANSVSGEFQSLDVTAVDPSAMLRIAGLSYEPDSVLLTIAPTPFNDETVGRTPNQRALGTALQRIADAGPTPVTTLLQQLPTLDGVRASYNQLSGQSRPALAPVAMTGSAKFMGIVSNRLQGAHGVAAGGLDSLSDSPLLAMALPDVGIGTAFVSDAGWDQVSERNTEGQDWGVWAKAYGLYGDRETESGTPGYSYDVFGQSFGVDLQFTERFMGGVTAGLSDSQVDYDRLSDEASIGATHAGLYSNYSGDGWYLSSLAMYSWLNLDTKRVVDLTGERHKGSFDGHEWSGYVEAGLDWEPAATWLVQPLAGLQVAFLHLDGYAETGLSSALVYSDQDYESYKGSLGARVTKELVLDSRGHSAIIQSRARWVHEFGDAASSVDVRFEDVPSVWWTVQDEELSRDSLLLGTGAGIRLAKGLRVFVDYDASLSSDYTIEVISGAVEYRW